MIAVEANADGLVGPTHSYVGLSLGNLASARNAGEASNPRAAALEGLAKMAQVAGFGIPQFVLPPHERPDLAFLRRLGFAGTDAQVLDAAWERAPDTAAAACSASAMWAANAATVTPSADSADGRVHFTPANLVANLHRSLEPVQTTRALRRLFPDPELFVVHEPLSADSRLADEGAANHVRLCVEHGASGVNLFAWGRQEAPPWDGGFPARQTREAFTAVIRRHGARRPVLAQQSARAIQAGVFHNDVVCVGTKTCLLYHQAAFEETPAVQSSIRTAASGLFEPVFLDVSDAELPLADVISTYLFNSQLLEVAGKAGLLLLAPVEVRENARARAVAERLVASAGPIGAVEYVDVRQSMRNGGGPACLRLRVVLTARELAGANPGQRLTPALRTALSDWITDRYRDRLAPSDLRDPALIEEGRAALDALTGIMDLGSSFYPFQRA